MKKALVKSAARGEQLAGTPAQQEPDATAYAAQAKADATGGAMIFPKRLRWLGLTLAVAFLDRATKAWIESRPGDYFPHTLVPGYLNMVFSRNPGIAFSFFSDPSSNTTRYALIAGTMVIIGVIAWMLVASRHLNALSAAGLALLLAGATGNVTDRIVHAAVTDFIQVYVKCIPWHVLNPWPTFNVADSAVTIGAILIILDVLFARQNPAANPP